MVILNAGTIVDACYIHQFAASRNNALNNGIALSKNAHWLFDNGLWSLRDDYTVLVAERHFSETGEASHLLIRMRDRTITLLCSISVHVSEPDICHPFLKVVLNFT